VSEPSSSESRRTAAADETPPEAEMPAQPTTPDVPADEDHAPVQPTRRERRAKGGGPNAKVHGPVSGKNVPVPAKGRDYAHRRRG
jgi:hypothetical protein